MPTKKLSRRESALVRHARQRALAEFESRQVSVFINGQLMRTATLAQVYALQELDGDKSKNISVRIGGPY